MTFRKKIAGALAAILIAVIGAVVSDYFLEIDVLDRIWDAVLSLWRWLAGITWVGWWAFGATGLAFFFAWLSWPLGGPSLVRLPDEQESRIEGVLCRWTGNNVRYYCPDCHLRISDIHVYSGMRQPCGNCKRPLPPVDTDLIERQIERRMRLKSENE